MTSQRLSRPLVIQAPRVHPNSIARSVLLSCLALASLLATVGCSSGGGDQWTAQRPKTYPVQGVVRFKGKPVDGATVVFNSAEANRAAAGLTDSEGRFTLTTFDSGDGAVAGPQQVRISKVKTEQSSGNPELTVAPPKETHLLPAKYADFNTSGLTADVKPDGENHFDFDLTE
jgi:hypothetical protein